MTSTMTAAADVDQQALEALRQEWIARGGAEAFWDANVVSVESGEAYLDAVYRQAAGWHAAPQPVAAAQPHDGPLARLGRATVGLADAALGVVR